jgi:hypothetical protein
MLTLSRWLILDPTRTAVQLWTMGGPQQKPLVEERGHPSSILQCPKIGSSCRNQETNF